MQNIILAISILLAINALLLIFSVNRTDGTKSPKAPQKPPPPITKWGKEEKTGFRATEPNGTTVFRNLKQIEHEIS